MNIHPEAQRVLDYPETVGKKVAMQYFQWLSLDRVEEVRMADSIIGLAKLIDDTYAEQNIVPEEKPEESKISIQASDVLYSGYWDEVCKEIGLDPWCINEGRMDRKDYLQIPKSIVKNII